jgi:Homeodomain-like domain
MPKRSGVSREEVLALSEQGLTEREIGERLGISQPTVHRRLKPPPKGPSRPNQAGNRITTQLLKALTEFEDANDADRVAVSDLKRLPGKLRRVLQDVEDGIATLEGAS